MSADPLLTFLGEVVAYAGGAAVASYFLFQFLGKSWIENKFKEKLEHYKHEQAMELQRLRVQIDSALSATLKIQTKEFEALPEAWSKLNGAFGQVASLVSPFQQYADVDRMSIEELDEFLSESGLLNSQKKELRESTKRLDRYREFVFGHRLMKVHQAYADFHNYLAREGIFFPQPLKGKLQQISDALWSALNDTALGHELKDYKMQSEAWKRIKDTIEPLYQSIELDIQQRLHSHGRGEHQV